jgi:hypothetical protein
VSTAVNAPWLSTLGIPAILVPLLAVAIAFGAMATADALWPDPPQPAIESTSAAGDALRARGQARLRCDTCGVIETITRSDGGNGLPASYAFGVRMPDGSLRSSTDPLPGRWQVGERVILIGGTPPPAP